MTLCDYMCVTVCVAQVLVCQPPRWVRCRPPPMTQPSPWPCCGLMRGECSSLGCWVLGGGPSITDCLRWLNLRAVGVREGRWVAFDSVPVHIV